MAEKQPVPYEESDLYRIRHSSAHIMAQAVLEMFPEAKYTIGPPSRMASTMILTCRAR